MAQYFEKGTSNEPTDNMKIENLECENSSEYGEDMFQYRSDIESKSDSGSVGNAESDNPGLGKSSLNPFGQNHYNSKLSSKPPVLGAKVISPSSSPVPPREPEKQLLSPSSFNPPTCQTKSKLPSFRIYTNVHDIFD